MHDAGQGAPDVAGHWADPTMPAGTLVAPPGASPTLARVMAYGPDAVLEVDLAEPDELAALRATWPVVWIDVVGLADAATIGRIGRHLGMHTLALEDVLNPRHHPKLEEYDDDLFLIMRMVPPDPGRPTEQLSLFLGAGFVVTFQQWSGDSLEPVRIKIRKGRGRLRSHGADYLAYSLLDAVVDGYFPLIESYGDRLDAVEESIAARPTEEALGLVQQTRRELRRLRRAMWPQRDYLLALAGGEYACVGDATRHYLRDCADHAVRVLDVLEAYHEWTADLFEFFMSSVNHRMNDVMRTLTVIATVFIPLTFVAGVYGMNFDTRASPWNMPELAWRFGYPAVIGGMAALALFLFAYFVRKGWIGRPRPVDAVTRHLTRRGASGAPPGNRAG